MQLSHTNSDSELNNDNIGKQLYFGCFSALKRNPYIIGIVLIAMAIFMYGIMGIYGFSAYPDEFGYWAPAAAMLGKDWSNITSIGSYYSYGYSVILLPVLFVFHDSIVAYRVAIVLNLFFQCVSIVIIYKILVKLFPYQNRKCLSIAGGIAVLYPAWIFYTQTTMVEGLLNFLFLTALYLAMMFFEEPGVFRGIAFSIVLIYLYFVHMRCLGIIGAGIISLLVWIISHRKKGVNFKAFLMITGILILFGISFIIKNGVVENIYKGTSEYALSWNDYSGIGYRLSKLFTFDGLIYFLKDFCGKLLYLSLSTYTIGLWGIGFLVKKAFRAVVNIKNADCTWKDFSYLFMALAVIAQFMVAMIYLVGASEPLNDRLDVFLHGRYIDFFLPILISVGIIEMVESKRAFRNELIILIITVICAVVAYQVVLENETGFVNAHGFTMIGMSYFLKKPLLDVRGYFFKEFILSITLAVGAFIAVLLYRKFRQEIPLLFILLAQIVLGVYTVGHYIFPNQSYIYGDIVMGDKLKEIRMEYPGKEIFSVYEGGAQYIELVQFTDRDAHIEMIDAEFENADMSQLLSSDRILILSTDGNYAESADYYYEDKWEIGHLSIYYTP